MGVINVNDEFSCPITAPRMFQALFVDAHNLMPKIMPQAIKSVDTISGSQGVAGLVAQINFADGGPYKYAKHRFDAFDKDNFLCKYSVIEGDVLGDKLESISYEVKFEESKGNDQGSTCKIRTTYHTKGDAKISDEEIAAAKEKGMGMYKVVENYLAENPNVYA